MDINGFFGYNSGKKPFQITGEYHAPKTNSMGGKFSNRFLLPAIIGHKNSGYVDYNTLAVPTVVGLSHFGRSDHGLDA